MTAVLMTPPYLQFFDTDGVTPLNGGKVYTYTSTGGTFTTAKATYTTAAASVAAPNPVILNSRGIPETGNGNLWLSGTYDFKVTDSAGATVGTQLAVTAFTALAASSTAYFESFSGTGSQTAFTTSSDLGTDEKAIYVWVNSGITNVTTNGTFATDTGWTKGAGWTIAAGVADAAGAISTAISQTAAITLVQGQAYRVTYTITRSAGGLIPSVGGTSGTERTASGTYNEVIIAGSSQTIAFTGNAFTGTLDTILISVASTAGYEIINPSAYTISGTTLTFATAPVSGTNNIYVSAPSLLVGAASSAAADAAASAAAAAASQTAAATSETNAATSATTAAGYGNALYSTSTTSLAIGTGAKTFTTQSGKQYYNGQYLIAASAANNANFMHGTVTSYSGTTLVMNITDIGGSGTLADWNISLSGTQGAAGAAGLGVLLQTQTASASTGITFSSTYITSTYKNYFILINNLVLTSDNVDLQLQVTQSGTPVSSANYQASGWKVSPSLSAQVVTAQTLIKLDANIGLGNASSKTCNGIIWLFNPTNSTLSKTLKSRISFAPSADTSLVVVDLDIQFIGNTTALDGVYIFPASSTISSATLELWGVP